MPSDDTNNPPFEIRVADRVTRLPPYLFGRINKMIYDKRVGGDDVIELGMGNPSDPPEKEVIEKLVEAARDERNHRYSKNIGIANLRREVASKYFKRFGVRLDPDDEVITCLGSKEGFSHMCLAMMGPGDTALVPTPYFPVHVYAVALASGNVIQLPVTDSDKFLAAIAHTCETLYPRPKLLLLCYPHNPSSVTVEQPFFDEVVKLAKKYNLMVISDFAYADVAYDGYKPPSFLASPGAIDVGVEFTTMSKGYNMAGWRVGFCAGNREMINALATIKGYYDYGMFQAIQIAAIVALRDTQAAVEKQSLIYQGRRDALCDGLVRLGWADARPKAGMFVWQPIPEPWRSRMSTMDFAMLLLDKGNVAVSPGSGFGPAGEGYLRMSLVENEERLRQAVRQIKACLKEAEAEYSGKQPETAAAT
ncbi:Glutamate-pyruvate aminotransferase AlaC [Botrimarina colliarenosi]|uniref:Glutamate-pyruvate aminotransferase AlaC n=1 Tax=Botrimarina colliarenosi TaxID=2528001 RepID=A0A5C6AN69_9BACT|nr:aminotransferase class I/II-fold pyridoxal phosphate-dependent enzyme [Botrimarina colliarenosi]TWU00556.1 Glutamate-pyruvate aminotransferase AlaC [Botrimarina colliarenosi]